MKVEPQNNVSLIWAENELGVIGKDGQLPWNVPEDLEDFKRLTEDHVIIMGPGTWNSLPKRPLTRRANVVVSSRIPANGPSHPFAFASLEDALAYYRRSWVFVIGGAALFRSAMPYASQLFVTKIGDRQLGDKFAPIISETEWFLSDKLEPRVSATEPHTTYQFTHYRRRTE